MGATSKILPETRDKQALAITEAREIIKALIKTGSDEDNAREYREALRDARAWLERNGSSVRQERVQSGR